MFLDKRDEKGQFLSLKAFAISEEVAELGIKNFIRTEIFQELKNLFPEKYLILLFKKLIFESVYETSCKTLLSKYSKDKVIDTNFYSINLLKDIKHFSEYTLVRKKKKINLKSIKKFFKDFVWSQYSTISNISYFYSSIFRLKKEENKNSKIAVNFLEGLKTNERSDFFWYDKKSFFNNVITYFEDSERLRKDGKNKDLIFKKLKFLNIRYEYLHQLRYFLKNSSIDALRGRIEKINVLGDDKFFKKKALIFISKIQYMFNFFKENNVKVHYNSEEMGTANILRQIAIKLNGGCSFGRTKSYPTMIKGDFIGFFPNDIFFAWGKETARRYSQTENYIDYFVITGDHYPKISYEKKILLEKKINNLKSNNIKFFILILDNAFSENKELTWQLTFKEKMETFFKKIFAFQNNNPDVGLIIKSKRKDNLKPLKSIFTEITNLENKNKCIFINEHIDLVSHYSEFADFTISISPFIQGSIFHCLINNKNFRGAMFDDGNLSQLEKDIYHAGENKTIFKNLDKLLDEIKDFKNKSSQESDLGRWLDTSEHDPFCDGKGGQRVKIFLKDLINFYDQGLKTDIAIQKTINKYTKDYNSDKIYEKK